MGPQTNVRARQYLGLSEDLTEYVDPAEYVSLAEYLQSEEYVHLAEYPQ